MGVSCVCIIIISATYFQMLYNISMCFFAPPATAFTVNELRYNMSCLTRSDRGLQVITVVTLTLRHDWHAAFVSHDHQEIRRTLEGGDIMVIAGL